MVNDEHVNDRLVSFVLDELPEGEKARVTAHVTACERCRRELNGLERLLEQAGQRKSLSADEPLHESARSGLFAAINKEKESTTITRPDISRVFAWRRIMASPMVKIGIAAAIVVAAGLFGLSKLEPPSSETRFNLFVTACAAEEALFVGTSIVHIQNEIIVYAGGTGTSPADQAVASLGYVWLPMCSLKPDGTLQFNQLKLSVGPESYVVTDHSWYDPVTGCFSRMLKAGDTVVFANSFDGGFIYSASAAPDGAVQVARQPVAGTFQAPTSPAEYLGIAAGLKASLDEDDTWIQSVEEGTLSGGGPAHVYKVGIPDPNGQVQSYWLFKVRDEDSTIAEKEFVLLGRPQLLIRRVLSEPVEAPSVSWDLAEIEEAAPRAEASQQVSITPDMVIPNVSIEHMVERADFETYVFSTRPSWTGEIEITDCIDPASPGGRMFIMTARADDGRHLVLVQSPTYNKMLGNVVKQGSVIYTSPSGFKVWGGGPQKWFSQILLQSARASIKDPPSEDRIGYVLESPAGTFPALAVNGPVTDEELHALIDTLTPGKEYLTNRKTDLADE
jgi:hypothetical protein